MLGRVVRHGTGALSKHIGNVGADVSHNLSGGLTMPSGLPIAAAAAGPAGRSAQAHVSHGRTVGDRAQSFAKLRFHHAMRVANRSADRAAAPAAATAPDDTPLNSTGPPPPAAQPRRRRAAHTRPRRVFRDRFECPLRPRRAVFFATFFPLLLTVRRFGLRPPPIRFVPRIA